MNDKLKYLGNVIGNSIWFVIAQTLFPFWKQGQEQLASKM
jgi:hypothetical protein